MTVSHNMVPHLQQEYETQKTLFESQPVILQRFLESQAQLIAGALVTKTARLHFSLPDHVMVTQMPGVQSPETITIPERERQIAVGGFLQPDVREKLMQR